MNREQGPEIPVSGLWLAIDHHMPAHTFSGSLAARRFEPESHFVYLPPASCGRGKLRLGDVSIRRTRMEGQIFHSGGISGNFVETILKNKTLASENPTESVNGNP